MYNHALLRGRQITATSAGEEQPYRFTTVEQLVEDFIAAVTAARSQT